MPAGNASEDDQAEPFATAVADPEQGGDAAHVVVGDDDDDDDGDGDNDEHERASRFAKRLRAEARQLRQMVDRDRQDLWLRVCGSLVMFAGLVIIVIGTAMVTSAEGDRLHGWRHTTCTITRNYYNHVPTTGAAGNGTAAAAAATEFTDVCVYFSVTVHGDLDAGPADAVCAVPAGIAGRGDLSDPPACSNLPSRDALDVDYWRLQEGATDVECMVPTHGTIPAHRCVAAATTGGPGPTLWRTWQDRFVYLVRDPRESTRAIRQATRVQFGTGIALVVPGPFLYVMALVPLFYRSWLRLCMRVQDSHLRMRRNRYIRHADAHKLH